VTPHDVVDNISVDVDFAWIMTGTALNGHRRGMHRKCHPSVENIVSFITVTLFLVELGTGPHLVVSWNLYL